MTKTLPAIAVLAIAVALAVAGCGGSDSSSSSSAESGGAYGGGESASKQSSNGETGGAAAGGDGIVAVARSPELGKAILVDSKGFTLYDFHKDQGGRSACYGACAQAWPPLSAGGAPKAMEGAMASKLGTVERKDGTTQVTYAGHPLYTFVEDTKPGDAKGNDFSGFGAQWYALEPNGEEAGD